MIKLKAALAGAILSLAFVAGTASAAPVMSGDAVRSVAADASAGQVTLVHRRFHRHHGHRHRWHRHRWHRHRWHGHHFHYGHRHCRWKRRCGYWGCRIVRRCHRHW